MDAVDPLLERLEAPFDIADALERNYFRLLPGSTAARLVLSLVSVLRLADEEEPRGRRTAVDDSERPIEGLRLPLGCELVPYHADRRDLGTPVVRCRVCRRVRLGVVGVNADEHQVLPRVSFAG